MYARLFSWCCVIFSLVSMQSFWSPVSFNKLLSGLKHFLIDCNIFNAFISFVQLKLSPNLLNKCKQTVFGWTDFNSNKNCFFCSNDGTVEEVNICPETFRLAFTVYEYLQLFNWWVSNISHKCFIPFTWSSAGVDPVSPTQIAASTILYNIAATWEQVLPNLRYNSTKTNNIFQI